MKQYLVTAAAGKRLIGKALAVHAHVKASLSSGTVVIIAGTTNGYVAEEVLAALGQADGFDRKRFFRGITLPPGVQRTESGRLPDESRFPGDVVIVNGQWQKGRTIFDVVNDLKEGDLILKGANALDLRSRQAAVYIGHPNAGTMGVTLQAVTGRRVRLILPVGLEKRVCDDLHRLAMRLNEPGCHGPRLLPICGEVFTEIDAIMSLTGASASLIGGGGVGGAEGSIGLAIDGTQPQMDNVDSLLASVMREEPFAL